MAQGQEIFSQGAPSDHMYVLIEGKIKILHDGHEVVKVSVKPDQPDGLPVFGEAGLVDVTAAGFKPPTCASTPTGPRRSHVEAPTVDTGGAARCDPPRRYTPLHTVTHRYTPLQAAPRGATLLAMDACHLLVLYKKNFRSFINIVPDFKVRLQNLADLRKKESQLASKIQTAKKVDAGEQEAMMVISRQARSMMTKRRASATDN